MGFYKPLLFITAQFIVHFIHAQQGTIEYYSIYNDVPTVEKEQDFRRKSALEINDMRYELRYNTGLSFFEELPRMPHDDFMGKFASLIANSDRPWYQNAHTKSVYRNKRIKDSMYIVVHDDRMEDWVLYNETKDIDGYTCYKATKYHMQPDNETEFTILVWYTPEIPLPFGPVGYGGLPGLILEMERSHVIFVADKLALNPKEKIKPIKEVAPGRSISLEEKGILMRRARKVTED